MPETDLTSGADRNPVEVLAEEFVERRRRGECPSLSEYTRKYPELAEAIADLFPALLVMERVKPAAEGRPASGGPEASFSHRSRRARDEASSAISGFSARSRGEAWGSSTRPSRSRWAAMSRSRFFRSPAASARPSSSGSSSRRALPGGCTMGTSCRSTAWVSTRECTTMPCSSSMGTAWTRSSTTCGGCAAWPTAMRRRDRRDGRCVHLRVPSSSMALARSLAAGAFEKPGRTATPERRRSARAAARSTNRQECRSTPRQSRQAAPLRCPPSR